MTVGISTPISTGVFGGVSAAFRLGEPHGLAEGAVIREAVALHVTVSAPPVSVIQAGFGAPSTSISTQIFALRRLLNDNISGETGQLFASVAKGVLPLVVTVNSADAMVALLRMKKDVEQQQTQGRTKIKMVFMQAVEAHIVAKEIAQENVGVILNPLRPFPVTHDERRIVPGPPLSQETHLTTLLKHNITVAVGIREEWEAINTRFALKWVRRIGASPCCPAFIGC